MNFRYKNISLVLIILSGVFILLGSTFAYWVWNSENGTLVSFTVTPSFSCSADGGGAITGSDKVLIPTECTDTEHVIKRKITASSNASSNVYMNLWLDVVSIDTELSQSSNLRYRLTTSSTRCDTDIIQEGNLSSSHSGSKLKLFINNEFIGTSSKEYYLYIWLDKYENNINTRNKNFTLKLNGECTDTKGNVPSAPDLDEGLIPVVFDTSGNNTIVKSISSSDPNWYDYDNQKWANAVLTTSTNRSTYKNNSGITIPESEILAYYVWIPRYSYKIWYTGTEVQTGKEQTIDIRWENSNTPKSLGTTVGTYLTHPAFTFGEKELSGIWVGKFETTGTGDIPTIKPDVQSLRNQNISSQFITSLKFSGGILDNGNVTFNGNSYYGLTSNIDSHMVKNIEWSAAICLSHSFYGKNREVYINNSSYFYTGRSGGNVGGQTKVNDIYQGRIETDLYNIYGYYTWDGYLLNYNANTKYGIRDLTKVASTTGNIYGIYDMSGGSWEYVMGSLNNRSGYNTSNNSGFTGFLEDGSILEGIPFPPAKYYDLYATGNRETACNWGICLGNSLSEMVSWYSDYAGFVSVSNPWLGRGGGYNEGVGAGAFNFGYSDGKAYAVIGTRSVLTIIVK